MLATLRAVFRTAYFLKKWTLNILPTYPQTIENKITIVMVYHFIFPIVEIKSVNEPENILKLKNRSSKRRQTNDLIIIYLVAGRGFEPLTFRL